MLGVSITWDEDVHVDHLKFSQILETTFDEINNKQLSVEPRCEIDSEDGNGTICKVLPL